MSRLIANRLELHERDLANGEASVWLPYALDRKFPAALKEFKWQFLFASAKFSRDPKTGKRHRHHLHTDTFYTHVLARPDVRVVSPLDRLDVAAVKEAVRVRADETANVRAGETANVRTELDLDSLPSTRSLTCRPALPDAADAGRGRECSACCARLEQEKGTIQTRAELQAGVNGPSWVRRVLGFCDGLIKTKGNGLACCVGCLEAVSVMGTFIGFKKLVLQTDRSSDRCSAILPIGT